MHPYDAHALAKSLMREHGLHDWTFKFSRAKRQLGVCRYDSRCIALSLHHVIAHDEQEVRDTILHEIAHALTDPDAGHGPAWRRICQKIGAKPERCARGTALPAGRWQARCPGCDRTFHRYRRPLRNRTYTCRTCGPERGKLQFRLASPMSAAAQGLRKSAPL